MPFPYKTVLLTGATSGIGLALAERIVGDGASLIAVGRRRERLDEFLAKHGPEKVAVEQFDVSNLDDIPDWVKKMTTTYPKIDCIFLNAGFQEQMDFTNPSSISLATATSELTTNYLSPLHTITNFLPHLTSLGSSGTPASIVLVTSGLAIVPIPRCPNYCASKAALHSLAWTLRSQLAGAPESKHIRVIEVIPPAVKTELHTRQGLDQLGVPLEVYADDVWAALKAEEVPENEEVMVHQMVRGVEDAKRQTYEKMVQMLGMKP